MELDQHVARELIYYGSEDITLWLLRVNVVDPVVFPEWPRDEDKVPVYLEWSDALVPFVLGVAGSRQGMLASKLPGRLWFCHIPINKLCRVTDVDENWFKGDVDG